MNAPVILAHRWTTPGVPELPLGPAYLASYARKYAGCDSIRIITGGHDLADEIIAARPALAGFYSYTAQVNHIIAMARKIKNALHIPLLLGGPHISSVPEQLPPEFDIGVIGEGEPTFAALLKLAETGGLSDPEKLEQVPGLVFHGPESVIKTAPRGPVEDIDSIPFPARDLFSRTHLLHKHDPLFRYEHTTGIDMFTVRGCPFKCTYCQQAAFGHSLRLHSAGYVAREIRHLYDEYGMDCISFADDLFTVKKDRIREIITLLRDDGLLGKIRFRADIRANLVDDEMIAFLKQLGIQSVSLGFETASARILENIKGTAVSPDKNMAAVQKLNRAGLGIYGCFMMGMPGETPADMDATAAFIRSFMKNHPFNMFNVNPFTPLPGTGIWDDALKNGAVRPDIPWHEFGFGLDSFDDRSYTLNAAVGNAEISRRIKELFAFRRRIYYRNLLFKNPLQFCRLAARRILH